MKIKQILLVGVFALFVVLGGCAKRFIPNTEIEDNEENRAVVAFCERYRHAVEDLNIGLLLSFVSPNYFDNSGTIKSDDDMDRAGVEEILKSRFQAVKAVRYEIKYRNIYIEETMVYVEYTYNTAYQYDIDGKTHWSNKTSDNRLELERVDDGFLILAGM